MKLRMYFALLTLGLTTLQANAEKQDPPRVCVTANRVSLRVRPDINAELLDRAMKDEKLLLLGETNGWFAVQAPEIIDLWVAGKFIQDGVVQPEKLNVRSGPNLNYSVVRVLNKGDKVSVRGEFNEWKKIAPPPQTPVWISSDFAQKVEPPKPEPRTIRVNIEPTTAETTTAPKPTPKPHPKPAPKPAPKPKPTPSPKPAPKPVKKVEKPLLLILDKTKPQGEYDEIPGVLRRANPGLYKLVYIDGEFEEPICLVRGEHDQMERLLGRSMLIKGKKYWAKGVRLPILQPAKIHLDPILDDVE